MDFPEDFEFCQTALDAEACSKRVVSGTLDAEDEVEDGNVATIMSYAEGAKSTSEPSTWPDFIMSTGGIKGYRVKPLHT